MAEVLDALPAPAPRTLYPWSEWMDGRPRRLRPRRDFYASIRGMRSTVQTRARAVDIAVAMVTERDTGGSGRESALCVQFFPGRRYDEGPPRNL